MTRRTARKEVRLYPDEVPTVDAQAKAAGLTFSDHVRHMYGLPARKVAPRDARMDEALRKLRAATRVPLCPQDACGLCGERRDTCTCNP